jgi:hypothetical protein
LVLASNLFIPQDTRIAGVYDLVYCVDGLAHMKWKHQGEAMHLLLPLKPVALHATFGKILVKYNIIWGGNNMPCNHSINCDGLASTIPNQGGQATL